MALKIDKPSIHGVTANYHRIASIAIEVSEVVGGEGYASVLMRGYPDQNARHATVTRDRVGPERGRGPTEEVPAAPILAQRHNVPLDKAALEAIYAAIYAALKTLPEFAAAKDA